MLKHSYVVVGVNIAANVPTGVLWELEFLQLFGRELQTQLQDTNHLCRCWCSMLSLYNHKSLHQQPDTVNPHNEPEIANHQFGMGESHS